MDKRVIHTNLPKDKESDDYAQDLYIQQMTYVYKDSIKKSIERLLTTVSKNNISPDRKTTKTRKQNWEEKQLQGYFKSVVFCARDQFYACFHGL